MNFFVGLLFFQQVFASSSSSSYTCVHDDLVSHTKLPVKATQSYPDGHSRRLQLSSPNWKPIRIKPVYINVSTTSTGMTANKVTFLKEKLIPEAISAWSNMLSVQPISGKLYAGRDCEKVYTASGKCKEFKSTTTCSDGHSGFEIDLAPYFGRETYYATSPNDIGTVLPAGSSTINENVDYILFITTDQTSSCDGPSNGESGTLAYALSCQTDQYGRPLIGRTNFCPYAINLNDYQTQLTTALHEINHALGFSSNNFPDWIFDNKTAIESTKVAKSFKYLDKAGVEKTSDSYLPSSSIVNFFAERGMNKCNPSALANYNSNSQTITRWTLSDCVHKIVTPRVVLAARKHFNCETLNGAELENHLTTASSLIGSHWEQRIFNNELMGSYVQYVGRISAVTLALHEDSGWYKANYSGTPEGWRLGDWGFKQGCAFALDKCITNGVGVASKPQHFFAMYENLVSLPDGMGAGTSLNKTYASVPSQYRYWSQGTIGGVDGTLSGTMADFCPMIQVYPNTRCYETPGTAYVDTNANGFCQTYTCTSTSSLSITLIFSGTSSAINGVCTSANAGKKITLESSKYYVCLDPAILCADRIRILLDTTDIISATIPSSSPSPTKVSKVSATLEISGLTFTQYSTNKVSIISSLTIGFASALNVLESQISIDRVYASTSGRILQLGSSKLSIDFSVNNIASTSVSSMKTLVVSALSSSSTSSSAISTMLSSIAIVVGVSSSSLSTSVNPASVTVTDTETSSGNAVDTTAIIASVVSVAIVMCCCVAIACVCGQAIKSAFCCVAKPTRVIPQAILNHPQQDLVHPQPHYPQVHPQSQYPPIQMQPQFQQPQNQQQYYNQPHNPGPQSYYTQPQTASTYYVQPVRGGTVYKERV